jgi:GMP synthase (glutamine-hydrolysing)
VCGLKPNYEITSLRDTIARRIHREVGKEEAILLYSGGVDSSVVGRIASDVLGDRLHAVTFDGGHLRENEIAEIRRNGKHARLNLTVMEAPDEFIASIGMSIDPERKRAEFRQTYSRLARLFGTYHKATCILQGTIAPDRIESGMTGGARIKTHHNSAGLDFGGLREIHPIDELYKDEVRALAQQVDLPLEIFNRPPFPGPGNFIRVVNIPTTREALAVVQWAEARVRELANANKKYRLVSQLVVATVGRAVGVKGDQRVFGYIIAVRGVRTLDFMTAEGVAFEPDFQKLVSKKLGEHALIVQVGFFPTDKPPGTTEFE